jgi:hypothetical protein
MTTGAPGHQQSPSRGVHPVIRRHLLTLRRQPLGDKTVPTGTKGQKGRTTNQVPFILMALPHLVAAGLHQVRNKMGAGFFWRWFSPFVYILLAIGIRSPREPQRVFFFLGTNLHTIQSFRRTLEPMDADPWPARYWYVRVQSNIHKLFYWSVTGRYNGCHPFVRGAKSVEFSVQCSR